MTFFSTIGKISCQMSHLMSEIMTPSKVIYIDGALHYNYSRHDFMEHNLGDDLNFPLIAALSHRKPIPVHYVFGHRTRKNVLLAIGSTLEACVKGNSIVWGAGFISSPENVRQPRRICAVRGPLTHACYLRSGIQCPKVFGDPALLLPQIYNPLPAKQYDCALIPHVIDWNSTFALQWRNKGLPCFNLKNYGDWHEFIDELCKCRCVISSSLHGIILAEAYGIPAQWIKLSNKLAGGDFKFKDYYLSYRSNVPDCIIDTEPRECTAYIDAANENLQFPGKEMVNSLLQAFPYDI